MPAYLVVEHIITDAAKFEEYRVKVGPMIAKHSGRYLTRGGSHKMPEGGHWKPERVVIIEFPDMASLNAWYNSAEYQPLIALRKQSTSDQDMMFTLEGVRQFCQIQIERRHGGHKTPRLWDPPGLTRGASCYAAPVEAAIPHIAGHCGRTRPETS